MLKGIENFENTEENSGNNEDIVCLSIIRLNKWWTNNVQQIPITYDLIGIGLVIYNRYNIFKVLYNSQQIPITHGPTEMGSGDKSSNMCLSSLLIWKATTLKPERNTSRSHASVIQWLFT